MEVYQLSKINGKYWWTATINTDKKPEECGDYKWTTDKRLAEEISGSNIN